LAANVRHGNRVDLIAPHALLELLLGRAVLIAEAGLADRQL